MTRLSYRIDELDRIVAVGGEWDEFARQNGGPSGSSATLYGRPLLDFVGDEVARGIYAAVIRRARAGQPVSFNFRCDAPERRREFKMEVRFFSPAEVEFTSTLLRDELRKPIQLLNVRQGPDAAIRLCSWCHAVSTSPKVWIPLEEAFGEGRVFEHAAIRHSVCPACIDAMLNILAPASI